MTKMQRIYSVFLAVILLGVTVFLPDLFFLHEKLYRHFSIDDMLEKKWTSSEKIADLETLTEITISNIEYSREAAVKWKEKQKAAEPTNTENKKKTGKDQENAQIEERGKEIEDTKEIEETTAQVKIHARPELDLSLEKLASEEYLLNQFFIVDENTSAGAAEINAKGFLQTDLSIKKSENAPQILIYHSHSQETFADSREGEEQDTIVGVGTYLAELLEKDYGYHVLHITKKFDLMSGVLDRSKAYDYARNELEEILQQYPSIEVVIDLHRDGVPDDRHLVTTIDGKRMAQVLFYNGLSYTKSQGKVSYLPNPYIQENLAFSFQMEYESARYYPSLYRGIYLAGLRYNLHLMPRTLLLEVGAQTNTLEEVRNSMEPIAFLLDRVLSGNVDCPE